LEAGESRGASVRQANFSDGPGRKNHAGAGTSTRAVVRQRLKWEQAAVEFEGLVGNENVAFDRHLTVSPANIEQTRELFRVAASSGYTIVPAGAVTWLELEDEVERPLLIVKTTRMNRLLEHEPADLIATAQAGMRFSEFNHLLLQSSRQWLPLDPPDNGRSTLGGVVATGLGGPQSLGYGLTRSSVIGMHAMLADGTVIKAGGKVVKNVAGYDLCKLFTGSLGALGLILDMTFKLRPKPKRETTTAFIAPLDKLITAAKEINRSALAPVALELVSASAACRMNLASGDKPSLLIRSAGNELAVDYQCSRLLELASQCGAEASVIEDDESVWSAISALSVADSVVTSWRAHMLPTALGELLLDLEKNESLRLPEVWHAGLGDGRLRAVQYREEVVTPSALNELKHKIQLRGGVMVIEMADLAVKSALAGPDDRAVDKLERRIKAQLDPDGIIWSPEKQRLEVRG
jgi:FAD/FMN-containing dehydrogenase